jgi:hypothetical protein
MLLAMQAVPVVPTSDMSSRVQVYGTILDFLVLAGFLGAISLIRYLVVRTRRRTRGREKIAVS